jgi:hypothetical protein
VTDSVRAALSTAGCVPIGEARAAHGDRAKVRVGGVVLLIEAASGTDKVYLEDETGVVRMIVGHALWATTRATALMAVAMVVDGTMEHHDGETTLHAKAINSISLSGGISRGWADWRGPPAWQAESVWDDLPPEAFGDFWDFGD